MLPTVSVTVISMMQDKNSVSSAILNVKNVFQLPIIVRHAEETERPLHAPAEADFMMMKILSFGIYKLIINFKI